MSLVILLFFFFLLVLGALFVAKSIAQNRRRGALPGMPSPPMMPMDQFGSNAYPEGWMAGSDSGPTNIIGDIGAVAIASELVGEVAGGADYGNVDTSSGSDFSQGFDSGSSSFDLGSSFDSGSSSSDSGGF